MKNEYNNLLIQVFRILFTVILTLLPLVGLIYLLGPDRFFRTITVVLSGRIFGDSWDRIHAGFVLDQPTIGKWYFWFSVFTIFSLLYMSVLRKFCIQQSILRLWIFAIGLSVLCLFLVCLLTIPFFWLIQYIDAMGWTQKRFLGLLYGLSGYCVVFGFYVWAIRNKWIKMLYRNPRNL